MMADWFEERGDEQLATWLRLNGEMVPTSEMLIRSLWELPARSRDKIRYAVVTEGVQGLERYMRSPFQNIIQLHLEKAISDHVETRTGRRNRNWRIIEDDGHSAGVGRQDFTYIEEIRPNAVLRIMEHVLYGPYDPNLEHLPLAVQMRHGTTSQYFGERLMNGELLVAHADVWHGTDGDDVLVSRFRPEHVRFWL
jgi:hypothetical protein